MIPDDILESLNANYNNFNRDSPKSMETAKFND